MGKYPDAEQTTPVSTERFVVKFHSGGYKVWDSTHKHFVSGAFTLEVDAQELAHRKNGNLQEDPSPELLGFVQASKYYELEVELAKANHALAYIKRAISYSIQREGVVTTKVLQEWQVVLNGEKPQSDHWAIVYSAEPENSFAESKRAKELAAALGLYEVPTEPVTLTSLEITMLAKRANLDKFKFPARPGKLKGKPLSYRVLSWYAQQETEDGSFDFYELRSDFDTAANRAAIEIRRKELGLGGAS